MGAASVNTLGTTLSKEDKIHPQLVPYVMAISIMRINWFMKMTNIKIPTTPAKKVSRLLAI